MSLLLLWGTVAALMSAPLLYAVAKNRPPLLAFLDGFVLVGIAGLVALEVLPGAFSEGGGWSLVFIAIGALGPSLLEHLLKNARREAHVATLGLAIVGLILHSLGDGAAMAPTVEGGAVQSAHEALGLAIVIHSVPVGLMVWWLMVPVFGPLLPALALAAMSLATLAGYQFGIELNAVAGAKAWAWFQAVIAGSILHVVFGRPHLEETSEHRVAPPPYEGLGNLAALALLMAMGSTHREHTDTAGFGEHFAMLAFQLAPLLLGFFVVAALVTRAWRSAADAIRIVDRAAPWTLVAFAIAALLMPYLGGPLPVPVTALHGTSLAILGMLYTMSLLRRGGRAFIAEVVGKRGHAHSHSH